MKNPCNFQKNMVFLSQIEVHGTKSTPSAKVRRPLDGGKGYGAEGEGGCGVLVLGRWAKSCRTVANFFAEGYRFHQTPPLLQSRRRMMYHKERPPRDALFLRPS